MIRKKLIYWAEIASIGIATVLACSAPSNAVPLGPMHRSVSAHRAPLHMITRRETIPPFAFAKYCAQQLSACEKQGESNIMTLSPDKRAFLQRINVQVNNEIVYRDDNGQDDDWRSNVKFGDCEDYALTKRQRLLSAGWPSGALRLATARTKTGEGHTVLVVTTSAGDLVLDNRTNIVKPWFATQLRWIKIQSANNPQQWEAL